MNIKIALHIVFGPRKWSTVFAIPTNAFLLRCFSRIRLNKLVKVKDEYDSLFCKKIYST